MHMSYIRHDDPNQGEDPPTHEDIPDSAFENDEDEDDSFWKEEDSDDNEDFSDEDAAAAMRG